MTDTHGKLVVVQDKGVERIGRLKTVTEPNGVVHVRKVDLIQAQDVVDGYNAAVTAIDHHVTEKRRLADHLLEADLTIEAIRELLPEVLPPYDQMAMMTERIRRLVARPEEPTDG